MTGWPHVARRTLIVKTLIATAAVGAAAAMPRKAKPLRREEWMSALYSEPESARAIGRAYLHQYPGHRDVGRLRELALPASFRNRDDIAPRELPNLRKALARQVRQDFEAGSVVRLDGWVLSRTEAALYALAAQTSSA